MSWLAKVFLWPVKRLVQARTAEARAEAKRLEGELKTTYQHLETVKQMKKNYLQSRRETDNRILDVAQKVNEESKQILTNASYDQETVEAINKFNQEQISAEDMFHILQKKRLLPNLSNNIVDICNNMEKLQSDSERAAVHHIDAFEKGRREQMEYLQTKLPNVEDPATLFKYSNEFQEWKKKNNLK
eukprot:TRINITY_DN2766_c0_g1_i1.p2 TRINITY_DN2766_c0_g1~~TRINITY_DN2766_c0_g1_i1.p2  ORF type:complete len:199 (+),score=37.43 TRINITY_DN2766_c0_g1_i1:38-598(+)